mgnify:CR=1 FL=1
MKPSSQSVSQLLPADTVQGWAARYIESSELSHKLAPPAPPERWASETPPGLDPRPGRPAELVQARRGSRTPSNEALSQPERRAMLLHVFHHHELQAAELMCWALLRFPQTPLEFRRGLLKVCLDEIRHMKMYAVHIHRLGAEIGQFRVRDWFWDRIPGVTGPASFLAVMGMGFEAGNLEHANRFAARFREIGDEPGAKLQEKVAEEEVSHVAFASHWFQQLTGELSFERWRAELPPPLTPMVMRSPPLNRPLRRAGGLPEAFIDALETWQIDDA